MFMLSLGRPLPVVSWWKDRILLDNSSRVVNDHTTRNDLTLTDLTRNDANQYVTCKAKNTNFTQPKVTVVKINLYCKCLTI